MRLFLLPALFLVLCFGPSHPNGFVLDNGHILTAQQHRALDNLFRAHEERTGNEIALVTTDTLGGRSMKDIAVAFGDSVGVGKKDRDNGVVIAFNRTYRSVFIATGLGTEKVLTDSICQRIVHDTMLPHFMHDEIFEGLWAGSLEIVQFLDRPENRIR